MQLAVYAFYDTTQAVIVLTRDWGFFVPPLGVTV